jgi:tetratricopeptide (TPR) repeat protein
MQEIKNQMQDSKQALLQVFSKIWIVFFFLLACQQNRNHLPVRENADVDAMYSLSSLQVLQKSIEMNPNDIETLYKLALWYQHRKEYKKAEEYLQDALKINEDWRFYLLEAQIQYALGAAQQSYITWAKAYRLAPQNLPVLLFGLQWAVEQKDVLKAEKWISETEKYFAKEIQLFLWKAKWATEQSDTTQAFELFKKALLQDASLTEPYKHISFLYNQTQKPELALEWANRGLLLRPLYDSLLLEKAIAWQKLKENDSAAKYFLQAYQLNRNLYEASYFLGIQRWKAANYTEAISFLENTYRLKQNLPKLTYYLANCYEQTQKHTQAIEFYTKSITQEPENNIAAQALYLLKQKLEVERQRRLQDSLKKLHAESTNKLQENMP